MREIELVDAGCGRCGFGLLAALKSDKAQVTCIEINELPLKWQEKSLTIWGCRIGLGFNVKCSKYKHSKPIDLLISNNVFRFDGGPQVQILRGTIVRLLMMEWSLTNHS